MQVSEGDRSAELVERLTGTLEEAVSSLENLNACEGDVSPRGVASAAGDGADVTTQACALKKDIQQAKEVR